MGRCIDLVGRRFGRLTVIERADNYVAPNGTRKARWVCQCDCGELTFVVGQDLRNGRTVSCGCFMRECTINKNTTHGKRNTRLYDIWRGMKERCSNPGHSRYSRYGGRGIAVCVEWSKDFQSFYDWAVAHGYQSSLTIDRIDNDRGYSPKNCRWSSPKEQGNNKSNNHLIELDGKIQTLAEWCGDYGVKYQLAIDRIRLGWTEKEALGITPRGEVSKSNAPVEALLFHRTDVRC